ncbi:hypothetical protein [Microbaculum marinisediminis]|uniref:Uncharacterized protein n=1 Tax=Microbaculum marinisediminis TaxID=2931392 RepID=A0AAW5QW20_9HYPH|nr:hypothetical protein [Microbaculum sp. A6E488]MCT8971215.1 hypothetical protein [Microbaculum sp. A6E488]
MKLRIRLTGADAPGRLARRLEAGLEKALEAGPEIARPPRLEGRFKDHRDIAAPRGEAGDLRVTPRPEPRAPLGGTRRGGTYRGGTR